jgi:hypothetical protein
MDIKEKQAKVLHNIFDKIIEENLQNLKQEMPIHVKKSSRTPNRHEKKNLSIAY